MFIALDVHELNGTRMTNTQKTLTTPHNPQHAGAANPLALSSSKLQQQQTWAAGDYAQVGSTLQIVGEELAEAVDLRPAQAVLDVAAGNGNFSLAAARRLAGVTATDLVPQLLEKGKIRALAEGYDIVFQQADAENLPMPDNSFDVVASVFGVMFTPDHQLAAAELRRVCRSGGRIALANWTPGGFIGQVFKTIGRYRPGQQPSPALWGTADHLAELFHDSPMQINKRTFYFRYHSPAQWVDFFRSVYGPMKNAFAALPAEQQSALHADLLALVQQMNIATDGTMKVPGEYLQVVIEQE